MIKKVPAKMTGRGLIINDKKMCSEDNRAVTSCINIYYMAKYELNFMCFYVT